jgi:hypothetical protein
MEDQTYTLADLVSFGNYLLTEATIHPDGVTDANLANWYEESK